MTARRLFLSVFTAALLAAFGCSSGTDSVVFLCSDGGQAAANAVNLSCAGATGGTTEQVDVVLGGVATASTTLSGLNFDLTYDPLKLEFVPAGSYTSPLFPGALIAVTLFDGQPGRVVVSIQNTEGALVTVGAGQQPALSLSFRRVSGIQFPPTPVALENAEATGASTTITFANGLSLSYQ